MKEKSDIVPEPTVKTLWALLNEMDWSKDNLEKSAREAQAQKAWAASRYKPSPHSPASQKKTDEELREAKLNDLSLKDMWRLFGMNKKPDKIDPAPPHEKEPSKNTTLDDNRKPLKP